MNEAKCDNVSRKHTIIMALVITALALFMLVGIADSSQSTNVWSNKGNELMSSEKYNEAIKAFDKAIEINPKNSDAWYKKGNILSKLGKYDEAIKAYEKAIEI